MSFRHVHPGARLLVALTALCVGGAPVAAQSAADYGTLNVLHVLPEKKKFLFDITVNFPYPHGTQNIIGEYSCARGFSVAQRDESEAFSSDELLALILKTGLVTVHKDATGVLGVIAPLNDHTAYLLYCLNDGRVLFSSSEKQPIHAGAYGNLELSARSGGRLDVTLPIRSLADTYTGGAMSDDLHFVLTPKTKTGPYTVSALRGLGHSDTAAVLMLEQGTRLYPIHYAGQTTPHPAVAGLTFDGRVKFWYGPSAAATSGWTAVELVWEDSDLDVYFSFNKPRPALKIAP